MCFVEPSDNERGIALPHPTVLLPQAHLQGAQSLLERFVPHSWEFGQATVLLCSLILQAKMVANKHQSQGGHRGILKLIAWTLLHSIGEQFPGAYSSMRLLKRQH